MADRKKMLPIGIDNFEKLRTNDFYYVDKTGLIADLLCSWCEVTLFTRPRRFGKSLNMSMLEAFFSPDTDKSLFDGLKITKEKELCDQYMGKYPVISLSLKGMHAGNFNTAAALAIRIIRDAARRYETILTNSSSLNESDQRDFRELLDVSMPEQVLYRSLQTLSALLEKHYGQKVIILIDEYDVPLAKAHEQGYYDSMAVLIRNLFESTLKTNTSLKFAVLTGCMRISKESIFTGLNNLRVLGVAQERADEYFGFTDSEVRGLLDYYGCAEKYGEVREWYDGYRFGNKNVYCPWDVINYIDTVRFSSNPFPENYWMNSSGNAVVRKLLECSGNAAVKGELEALVNGETVEKTIHQELTYQDMYASIDTIWSVLFTTGYLTQRERIGGTRFRLAIPNREVRDIFAEQILELFREDVGKDGEMHARICEALRTKDIPAAEKLLGEYLRKTISIKDVSVRKSLRENFYHGILLAILSVKAGWNVQSNQESGDGYSDIIVRSDTDGTAMIFELKYADDRNMDAVCKKALKQIEDKQYAERLYDEGYERILNYGIAFYIKKCRVMVQETQGTGV